MWVSGDLQMKRVKGNEGQGTDVDTWGAAFVDVIIKWKNVMQRKGVRGVISIVVRVVCGIGVSGRLECLGR